ncbi:MAG TPA: diphthine--ammonia ligase [Desulfobacteria bacterium]|nr:diphthine--ammonia ligase [Desulfobacteria bacterium]
MGKKVFVSWSGGKDAYLALLKAQEAGLTISTLVTFFRKDDLSLYHSVGHEVMAKQAAAMGFNLELEPAAYWDNGEALQRVMERLRQRGFEGGVFGDINSQRRRKLVEGLCSRFKMAMYMPLWGMAENDILAELRQRGCRLLIVSVRSDLIDEKWLGREIDNEFSDMCSEAGINPCGERGEFHTLVVDGPLFKDPLKLGPRKIIKIKNMAVLEIGS